ncbi:hypothetical protein [Crocosphaera sp. Alani8]|uniref:hypothetical protein n=1 Tax=Crocosphaera sp. Alani8 TaxID=3038952 RepID=UPI00313C760F
MIESLENRSQKSAEWIYNLVEILRLQNNSTWRSLVKTTTGKTATILLGDISLQLQASKTKPLKVSINYPVEIDNYNFSCDAETIRDIIAGKVTLDQALLKNQVYLRGTFTDLQGISQLIKEILADTAINLQLQRHWEDFEEMWSSSSSLPYYSLDNQQTNYAELISMIPEDILNIEIISE